MSNFKCEMCGTPILDSPRGYVTECLHYPYTSIYEVVMARERGETVLEKKLGRVDMANESSICPIADKVKTFKVTGKLNKDCVFSKIVTCRNKADAWQQTKQDINKISQLLHISIEEIA